MQRLQIQNQAKQHKCHILFLTNYTFEQHLHFSEQLNAYFLEIQYKTTKISVLS